MIHKFIENQLASLNADILDGFLRHQDDTDTRKSHHFQNRYENIYIDQKKIPALDNLFTKVSQHAAAITGKDKSDLQLGYWFNYMQPGDQTLAHSHDENDELLSCVYYVVVPEKSGSLYIDEGSNQSIIEPQASMLVFFDPDVVHHVGENKSGENRLSIGINIGAKY